MSDIRKMVIDPIMSGINAKFPETNQIYFDGDEKITLCEMILEALKEAFEMGRDSQPKIRRRRGLSDEQRLEWERQEYERERQEKLDDYCNKVYQMMMVLVNQQPYDVIQDFPGYCNTMGNRARSLVQNAIFSELPKTK